MEKYRKISILCSEFPPLPGGIGVHALNLARQLDKKGYDIQVLTEQRLDNAESEREFDRLERYKIKRIERKKIIVITYFRRLYESLRFSRNSDIVIVSGKFQIWNGAFLKVISGKKILAIVHGSELLLQNYFLSKITTYSLNGFSKIVAVSKYTKSLLPRHIQNKVAVIHNGYSLENVKYKKKSSEFFPILITVGNLTKRKGQHNVIRALPNLIKKFPDLKYIMIGLPSEKDFLEKLADDLRVRENVCFKGAVSNNEKEILITNSDIFCMLSEKTRKGDVEGFGIAIIEANALGVPAIGSQGCGIEEAINQNKSGILIESQNIIQFEKAIEDILSKHKFYSENARKWSNSFTWEKVIEEYMNVIESL